MLKFLGPHSCPGGCRSPVFEGETPGPLKFGWAFLKRGHLSRIFCGFNPYDFTVWFLGTFYISASPPPNLVLLLGLTTSLIPMVSFKTNVPHCESPLSYFVSNYHKIKWVTGKVSFTQTPIINSLNTPCYIVQKL